MALTSGEVDICNLAIDRIGGVIFTTANQTTDPNGKRCNRVYEQKRTELLRRFDWPFARGRAELDSLFVLTIDVAPSVAWTEDDIITGITSGTSCRIVEIISTTQYIVTEPTGDWVTDLEFLFVQQHYLLTITGTPSVPWIKGEVITGAQSGTTCQIVEPLTAQTYVVTNPTGAWVTNNKTLTLEQHTYLTIANDPAGAWVKGDTLTGFLSGVTCDIVEPLTILTIANDPAGAWLKGDTLEGATSTETCEIIEVLTTKTYVITTPTGAFTDGEDISNGTFNSVGAGGFPTVSTKTYIVTTPTGAFTDGEDISNGTFNSVGAGGFPTVSTITGTWIATDTITGDTSGETFTILEVVSDTIYRITNPTGALTDGESLSNGVQTRYSQTGFPAVTNYAGELLTSSGGGTVTPGYGFPTDAIIPTTWGVGDTLTGQISGVTCEITEVINAQTYKVTNPSGDFTSGEPLSNGSEIRYGLSGYPAVAPASGEDLDSSGTAVATVPGFGFPTDAAYVPAFEYSNAFALPTDFLAMKQNYSEIHSDLPEKRWYIEGRKMLFEDNECLLKYIKDFTNTALFDVLYKEVLILELALFLLNPIAGTGKQTLKQELKDDLKMKLKQVRAFIYQVENSATGRSDWNYSRFGGRTFPKGVGTVG